jgi:hypothetical protein
MSKPGNPGPQTGDKDSTSVQAGVQEKQELVEAVGNKDGKGEESKDGQKPPSEEKSSEEKAPEEKSSEEKSSGEKSAKEKASKEKSPEEEALELTQQEKKELVKERKQQLELREKEAKDRRSQLLKAVRFSAPAISKPLVETFERLSLENHQFAQKELVRMFKNDAQLQKSPDFFDLNLAQREDLLDRIGFYKGIVIDHSLSNPVETGFREVLQREVKGGRQTDFFQSPAAALLYRKPNFSGYYENYYTFSESLHQVQKNGVTDIKSSLNVVAGKAVSVGAGVSGAYYDADSSNEGAKNKKIYITANFFLPKVELSFDHSVPCASTEFETACEKALSEVTEEARFTALISVLGSFGQFVPTQTLVGGRLFATDVKEFLSNESESEMTTRYAARIKVGVESVSASFESDTSVEKGKQENKREKGQDEKQQYTIQAVGGEGAVVEQPGRWAESLYEYQRWSAVQREKLIPSIDLLNKSLRLRVWAALKAFAAKNSAMHLVGKYKAYFLFYGDYDAQVGQLTKRDIVIFKNNNSHHCLAVLGETPQNGGVTGKPFDWTQQTLWHVTPNGNVISAIPVAIGFPGRKKTVDFALTVLGEVPAEGANKPNTFPVGLRELGAEKYQTWEFTGRGELRNTAFGARYALSMPLDNRPVLKLVDDGNDTTRSWSAQEASPGEIEKIASRKVYGKLKHPSGLVLAIDGYEDSANSFTLADRRRLLLQPDNGGKHQLWHLTADGDIVSALAIASNDSSMVADVYLACTSDREVLAQALGITAKTFRTDEAGLVYTVDAAGKTWYAGAAVDENTSGQRVALVNEKPSALKFEALSGGARPLAYTVALSTASTGHCYRLKTVDKRELRIGGYLTGIEFILEERRAEVLMKMNEFQRLRMRLSVVGKNGPEKVELKDEPDDDNIDRDFLSDNDGNCDVRIDGRFLLLPEEPIYSIRLRILGKTSKRLAFQYRKTENGPWFGLSDGDDNAKPLNVNGLNVSSKLDAESINGTKVLGVALEYDPSAQLLRPKLLRRLVG